MKLLFLILIVFILKFESTQFVNASKTSIFNLIKHASEELNNSQEAINQETEKFLLVGNPYSDDLKYTSYENECLALYFMLNKAFSNFTDCAARTARPFNLCQSCIEQYMRANYIYDLINEDTNIYATTLYKNGLTCKDIVEATNRVQTVVKLYNIMNDIWTTSNCDTCFENVSFQNNTVNYTIKQEFFEFREIERKFQDCIFNYTHASPSIDPIFQNYTSNQTLCSICKNHYFDLTKKFSSLMADDIDENGMCMDIVDLFNYTRIAWSKGYKCNYRNIDEYSIFIISLSFMLATIAFYVVSRLIFTKEKIQFAKLSQRKSFVNLSEAQLDN